MTWTERGLAFDCQGQQLIGVACLPAVPADTGVVIVVGGPQYRAGSHRLFVRVSRRLAAAGYASLRFDCRGMGDSQGAQRGFDQLSDDVGAAIGALQRELPAVKRIVLWGLCDGASAALLYLDHTEHDPRVGGLCLLNPWVRSESTQAQTRVKHYYIERLKDRSFWAKLLSGRVAHSAVSEAGASLRTALSLRKRTHPENALGFQQRMARAWMAGRTPVMLVLSGRDYTAKEFLQACRTETAWRRALERVALQRVDFEDADHTFSSEAAAEGLAQRCIEWMDGEFAAHTRGRLEEAGGGVSEAALGSH
jgi:uncharacterized protein